MSPNYAGTIMGMANTVAGCAGFVSPIVTGYITHGQVSCLFTLHQKSFIVSHSSPIKQTIAAWQKVFFLAAIFSAVGSLAFIILCTAEVQHYNDPEWREKKKSENCNTTMITKF